jgi:hypothetical protein
MTFTVTAKVTVTMTVTVTFTVTKHALQKNNPSKKKGFF